MKDQDYRKARQILKKHGKDTLSYFSLQYGREYFFDKNCESFLSYRLVGKIAVVGADPIGPSSEIPGLVKEFIAEMSRRRIKTCFIGISPENISLFKSLKLRSIKIGEEAIIDLSTFDSRFLKKRVRRTIHYSERNGVGVVIYKPGNVPQGIRNQLQEIKHEWLLAKGRNEYGYSMALRRIPNESDDYDCELILAMQNKKVLGYLVMLPVYAGNSWSLDAMRKRADAPNGLVEFLIIKAAEDYKRRGCKSMSLNFSTFANSSNERMPKTVKHAQTIARKLLSPFYPIRSLYFFNEKFLPDWQSRYFVFPTKLSFPRAAYSAIKCEGLIPSSYGSVSETAKTDMDFLREIN